MTRQLVVTVEDVARGVVDLGTVTVRAGVRALWRWRGTRFALTAARVRDDIGPGIIIGIFTRPAP